MPKTFKNRKAYKTYKKSYSLVKRKTPMYKSLTSRVVKMKEKFVIDNIVSNSGYNGAVTLSNINAANLAAYQALYKTFKITGAKYQFIPDFPQADYNQATSNLDNSIVFGGQHRLVYEVNREDVTVPSTEAAMLARNNSKVTTIDAHKKPFSIYVKNPMYIQDTDAGSITLFKKPTPVLMNTDGIALQHFGLLWYMTSEGSGTNPYSVYVTLYFNLYTPI